MAFTQLQILINAGTSQANVTIALPPAVSSDPFNTGAATNAQSAPGVGGIVEAISRVGFWDSAGQNFYPPAAILKVTPL